MNSAAAAMNLRASEVRVIQAPVSDRVHLLPYRIITSAFDARIGCSHTAMQSLSIFHG